MLITAIDHVVPSGSLVDSGRAVAVAALDAIQFREPSPVEISFIGLRGAGSSYFNAMISDLLHAMDAGSLRERLEFRFDSSLQQSVFERSWTALTARSAAG